MRRTFDAILADPPRTSLEFSEPPTEPCTRRWCWCDALFMAPPAWFGLSEATGDARYFTHADAEYWRVVDYLYDPQERLFFRDSRYFLQRSAQGRKIFWSRGNGWVFAGLALLLEYTPPEKAQRFRGLFVEMSARIAELQTPSGYWPPSLLEPEGAPPETSGTGFFVFGLAWGVNNGLLDRTRYSPVIERGWTALSRAVHPDGKLGWVQQVGSGPDEVTSDMTQLYGAGALLLAGAEVHRMRHSRSAAQ
jgi:rhamnogalacturonyl hydrolase YesR